jgi:hypothetical protein
MHPVTIENDSLSLQVWPRIGGKVSSIIDKSDGYELLFTYPAEIPDQPNYDANYGQHWYAGWDECFPALAPGKYPGHPYDGISIPDHGELWGIPTTTAVPTRNGITTVWHGLRFGYRLTRKLYLENAELISEYSLANLSPFDFRFVWAMHPLFSLESPVILHAGDGQSFRLSHDHEKTEINRSIHWPGEPNLNFSNPANLPPRHGWKLFSTDPIQNTFRIDYPARKRSFEISYTSEDGHSDAALAAYWGIWINTGGWGGHRHFSIEPTTGRFDQLDRSIADNSAGKIGPFGRCQWSIRLKLMGI